MAETTTINGWPIGAIALSLATAVPVAAMEELDDSELSGIQGQSGVTVELETQASMDRFSYFTNERGIHLDDIQVGAASSPDVGARRDYDLDLLDDGSLEIGFDVQDERISVGGVSLDDSGSRSMGAFWMDRDMDGSFRITPGGAGGSADGYTFNFDYALSGGRFGYRTNGHQLFLDNVSLNVETPESAGHTLDVEDGAVHYVAPIRGDMTIGAVRYAEQSDNVRGDQSARASMGSFETDFDFVTDFEIRGGGGRQGTEGLSVDAETTLNTASFLYSTNGHSLAFKDITGNSTVQDLRVEVGEDFTSEGRLGLGFTLTGEDSFASGELSIGEILIGGAGSIGSVNWEWLYENQTINGEPFTNQTFVMAGGHPDAGDEGMRLASEWSLADAQLTYTTNGNPVVFDGIQSWGRGDVTVNVTGDETLGDTQFYEGLRVGFDDVSGGYRMDGLRVGGEEAEVQGGVELLSALGVYRSLEFDRMDGQYTLTPGGPNGEGLTINSDIVIEGGRAGYLTEESGQGVWADDLSYEGHIRDMTLEVAENGLSMIQGEAWSTMDIGNLRVGGAEDGASFGRIVWQRYGENSEMVISAPDSGEEGLKLALTSVFSEAVSDRANRFIWETGREQDSEGNLEDGSGMQLVLDNIHTSDGPDTSTNEYGVKTDLKVDVREVESASGTRAGFSVNTRTRFRELNIGQVNLVHPDGGAATALQGVSIQNMDMESNLNATPIP
ncbi:MAG: DUF6160 family protein [Pseudomonadota bacterium]